MLQEDSIVICNETNDDYDDDDMDYNEEEMFDFKDSNIVHGRHIHCINTRHATRNFLRVGV